MGTDFDYVSRGYDYINACSIIINLVVSIMYTFESMRVQYGFWLTMIEDVTVAFFALDFVLRVLTADLLHPTTCPFSSRQVRLPSA